MNFHNRTMLDESHDEAMACQQIEHDQRHANIHPVFAAALNSMCPPADDGQQQAQAEPEPPNPIEHLRAGGYRREAALMAEALEVLYTVAMGNTDADELAELAKPLVAKLEGRA